MNILIIGSGAREHAIAITLHRSSPQPNIYCSGKTINPGIKQMTHDYWVGDNTDVKAIVELARKWGIGLAIIGPEAPLQAGLADALWEASVPTIGPRKKSAQIETSKEFARHLMQKYKIPGLPKFQAFHSMDGIQAFLEKLGEGQYVVKANGLMGGKGVKVAGEHLHTITEALAFCQEILDSGQTIMIEQKLVGQEFSFMGFCDGETIVRMPIVQDHKRAFIDDKGPNTGGMGSYSAADHALPFLSEKDVADAWRINEETFYALMKETKEKYIGILYGSFIATKDGVYVIEFNARFGDPEALNVLTILQSDLAGIFQAMVTGNLTPEMVKFSPHATVCKYAVPDGYPTNPVKNMRVDVTAVKNKARLYYSSVDAADGMIFARGARTAAYVGVADSISGAEKISEREVSAIVGPLYHRKDIGTERLIQKRVDEMRALRDE